MLVQLPNEQDFLPADLDMALFKEDRRIRDIIYGWYENLYIAIKY